MIITTPGCTIIRAKLDSNKYAVQDLNVITMQLGTKSNDRFGVIDAFVITKEDFQTIINSTDPNNLVNVVSKGSPLMVITDQHFNVVCPKIRYVNAANIVDELNDLQVGSVDYNPTIKPAETLNISNSTEEKVEDINTKNIEEAEATEAERLKLAEKPVKQEIEKEDVKQVDEVRHVVSLSTLNLYDLIRIASLRDRSVSRLKDNLEKLTIRLRSASPAEVKNLMQNYLEIEDDFCSSLYIQFKLLIEELMRIFNSDVDNKVNSLCETVKSKLIQNTYGLSHVEINKLLDEREAVSRELSNVLHYISANYSNVNEVLTDFASKLQNYSFSNETGNPISYNDQGMSDKRFEIYQQLISIKLVANNYEQSLTDKIEQALSLIQTSFNVQDKLNKVVNTERFIKTQGSTIDMIVNTGPTYTTLKLLVMKCKLLSMFDVVVIDLANAYSDINVFDNNLTYVTQMPDVFDIALNYIIIADDKSLMSKAFEKCCNVYIPTNTFSRNIEEAVSIAERAKANEKRTAIVISPCNREHSEIPNAVSIPFIDILNDEKIYEECKYDPRILKIISYLR